MRVEMMAHSNQKIMQLITATFPMLARYLMLERKRQGLTRARAAAVCNVSPSFIRDAESDPASCSLGLLLQYMVGMGLSIQVAGWSDEAQMHIDISADAQDAESRKS